jgi:osmotically-inducible protein OsmY
MSKPTGYGSMTVDGFPVCLGPGSSVEQRLGSSGYLALRRIRCECVGDVLSLRGSVSSYYLKQMAQAIAGDVEGIRLVDNQIQVLSALDRRP